MEDYNPKNIEEKWRAKWSDDDHYAPNGDDKNKKLYVLDMFPYPSGSGLHVGHLEPYTATDIYSRYFRMRGYNVLHPMGWDAFGLPAENYAIKTGTPPQETTAKAIDTFRGQIQRMGLSYDWSREIGTHNPDYYKWTQWFFLLLYNNGLAYKKKAKVNWDPVDQTVLANEQVLPDGTAERSGAKVVQKDLEQWFFKITDFAEELIDDLDSVDWPDYTVANQRNWIGRSEGAEIEFGIKKKFNFVLLHGFTGSPKDNFFPWLKEQLEAQGHTVQMPTLPDTNEPTEEGQVGHVLKTCTFDENTILFGHSLGSVVALKVLEKLDIRIAGLVTAGGFVDPNFADEDRIFADKFKWIFNFEKIRNAAGFITVLQGDEDSAVSDEQAARLAQGLNVPVVRAHVGEDHFCAKEEPSILRAVVPSIRVFTTRPDTLFGATYIVLAPEHELVEELKDTIKNWNEVAAYVEAACNKTDVERTGEDKDKTGVKLEGVTAINPANKEEIPIYLADYVLAHYGTGAIMAVPAHDERDYEFAKKYDLPIMPVVVPTVDFAVSYIMGQKDISKKDIEGIGGTVEGVTEEGYLMVSFPKKNADAFEKMIVEKMEPGFWNEYISDETVFIFKHRDGAIERLILSGENDGKIRKLGHQFNDDEDTDESVWAWLGENAFYGQFFVSHKEGVMLNSGQFDGMANGEAKKAITEFVGGETKTTYRLRDWLVSRQRYWGAPIPIVYDPEGIPHPIPEEHLPWTLPTDVEFTPHGTSPLGQSKELAERTENIFGKGWKPEVDTMDTFVDSSWYFFRFTDPNNEKEFASKKAMKYWMPVDLYMGGAEHTVLHLLYARFFTKVLNKLGYIDFNEPFAALRHQGTILGEDNFKMSKSKGNVINPDDVVDAYGADTLRVYEMFMGPLEGTKPWNTNSVAGSHRFLKRVWGLVQKQEARIKSQEGGKDTASNAVVVAQHRTVKKITEDTDKLRYNTAVASFMEYVNVLYEEPHTKEQLDALVLLLAPYAPFIAAELWEQLGNEGAVHEQPWPQYDEAKTQTDTITVPVQVNGKLRAQIEVSADIADEELQQQALAHENVQRHLEGKEPKKVIVIHQKLVNIVV
ncbi:MAG: class I tRNA ligase family protein [Candidatus Spechtbacterales bacterium]